MRLISLILKVTFLFLLSPLVLYCARGDGFINENIKPAETSTMKKAPMHWTDIINPRLQASYEKHEKEKQERIQFSNDIRKYATLNKKQFDMVAMVHKFNLKGPHFDSTKFDDYTKWMRIYEKEISIAMNNYDAAAYVFFFEEFARLSVQRAGVIDPNCKIKDCECVTYKN